jgi:hypothetical protein
LHSLRVRLLGLWVLSLAAGVAVALLLFQLYEQSANAQVSRAEAVSARVCDLIRDRFEFFTSEWTGPAPDTASADFRTQLATDYAIYMLSPEGRITKSPLRPSAAS